MKLNNGAEILNINVALVQGRLEGKVLAKPSHGVHQYAVWSCYSDDSGQSFECYWGHYFNNPTAALAEFHGEL